jgi:zinc transport system substrate-binding protein
VAGAAPSAPHDDDHPAEAAGGQAGALIDQHAWLDPDNAAQWLAAIAERLAALDPDGAALYRANAAAGQAELATLSDGVADRLAGTTAAGFVLLHDATQYFEGRFGLRAAGSLSAGDAAATGPVRLAEIRALIDDSGVACLVAEPQHDAALVERLSAETGVPVVLIDPLGADLTPGPALYPALLEGLSERFEACFSGS